MGRSITLGHNLWTPPHSSASKNPADSDGEDEARHNEGIGRKGHTLYA